jgi:hypothetical protein
MVAPITFPVAPQPHMYQLTLLGSPTLRDRQGREITVLTAQPERLLLLGWMACEEPVGFRKREELLERFFDSGDGDARRNALRQALHALRTHIDPAIFIARGSDELRVNSALVGCDLSALRTRLRAGETVDRESVAAFADGVDIADLPVQAAAWVTARREEVEAIRNGTAEFAVPTDVIDAAAEKSGAERSRGASPTPAPSATSPTPASPARANSTTRPDYAERLHAATADRRPRLGDEPSTRAWTYVAAGVLVALLGVGGWFWWRGRPAPLSEPAVTSSTIADSVATAQSGMGASAAPSSDEQAVLAALDADAMARADSLSRAWMQRAPSNPAPAQLLARQLVLQRRLEESAMLVDSARARGASELWAREERVTRAMAGGFWPVARDLIADSTSVGMTATRARWWRTTFERLRGRPLTAATFARGLITTGVGAIDGQLPAVPVSEVVGTTVGALLDASQPGEAMSVLAAAPAPTTASDSVRYVIWRGRVLTALGDTTAVARLADSLDAAARGRALGRLAGLPSFLRGLAQVARRNDAAAVPLFEQALATSRTATSTVNLSMARALLAVGRPADAVEVLRSALRTPILVAGAEAEPFPTVHEQLALAHAAVGARDSARIHARAALDAWSEAEPLFRARAASLRRAVGLVRRARTDSTAAAQLE